MLRPSWIQARGATTREFYVCDRYLLLTLCGKQPENAAMNSVFCRYSSLEPAVIQEVINVFRDGDDEVDMEQVHRALSEMCPSSDGVTSRQYERLVDATTPGASRAEPVDVSTPTPVQQHQHQQIGVQARPTGQDVYIICLLYTSPSPRDRTRSRMPSSA